MLPVLTENQKRFVYLDHAAATPLDPAVEEVMRPFGQDCFGNPSALYDLGQDAKRAIRGARETIAQVLNCTPEEIIFTPSGTASDNLAVFGIVRGSKEKNKHAIISAIEHHAVLRPAEYLAKKKECELTVVPVDNEGLVSVDTIAKAIRPETILVSIMYANNEIGTIQPIAEIGSMIKKLNKERATAKLPRIYFHTDACQAAGALSLDVKKLNVDLLTINGSKIYGPKGSGALFVARGVQLEPLVVGGGQERNLVAGTENVANIVGLAKALQLANQKKETENTRLMAMRDRLIAALLEKIPKCRLNGHASLRLPNNVNITVLDVEGEAMLLYLNEYGISCATGSACDSETLDPSHVILALGLPYEFAHGSMRFTLGRSTTEADLDYLLQIFPPIVEALRAVSPVKLEMDPEQNTHAKIIQH